MDAKWKARVKAALKAKGMTQKDLAAEIGCDPSAITVVLRDSTVQTRLMPAINLVLGLGEPPAPLPDEMDELDAALIRAIRAMDEPAKRHLLGLTEAILGRPKNAPKG